MIVKVLIVIAIVIVFLALVLLGLGLLFGFSFGVLEFIVGVYHFILGKEPQSRSKSYKISQGKEVKHKEENMRGGVRKK